MNNNTISQTDISTCKTFLKTALATNQMSEETFERVIDAMKTYGKNKTDQGKVITIRNACEILKISKPTVYSLIRKGKLRIYKLGKCSRLLESDVMGLFSSSKSESTEGVA